MRVEAPQGWPAGEAWSPLSPSLPSSWPSRRHATRVPVRRRARRPRPCLPLEFAALCGPGPPAPSNKQDRAPAFARSRERQSSHWIRPARRSAEPSATPTAPTSCDFLQATTRSFPSLSKDSWESRPRPPLPSRMGHQSSAICSTTPASADGRPIRACDLGPLWPLSPVRSHPGRAAFRPAAPIGPRSWRGAKVAARRGNRATCEAWARCPAGPSATRVGVKVAVQ
jgi:hypothetical protein